MNTNSRAVWVYVVFAPDGILERRFFIVAKRYKDDTAAAVDD